MKRIVFSSCLFMIFCQVLFAHSNKDILLITLDTTRADHLPMYGYPLNTTPFLNELSQQGTLFLRAYTPVPLTLPAHTTLFTGMLPIEHHVRTNVNGHLSEELLTVAEILKQNGYITAGFVSSMVLAHTTGIDQGFEHFDDRTVHENHQLYPVANERWADETTLQALEFLKSFSSPNRPLFLWVHYYDPHTPYIRHKGVPPGFSLYDAELYFMDRALRKLIESWRQTRSGLIILAGDHGEALGNHGEPTHGVFVYNETVHIPLIIVQDNLRQAPTCNTPVSIADIFPTILEFARIPSPPVWGRSLLPFLTNKAHSPLHDIFFFESLFPARSFGWAPPFAIMKGNYKYTKLPKPELYNIRSDPDEKKNLVQSFPRIAEKLERLLEEKYGTGVPEESTSPSLEHLEKLKALGYSGGSRYNPERDPKDLVWIVRELEHAQKFLDEKNIKKARELLSRIIRANPENYPALIQYGIALNLSGKRQQAMEIFSRAIKVNPDYLPAYFNLGAVAMKLGKFEYAKKMFKKLLDLNPNIAEAWVYLCAIELKQKNFSQAEFYLQKARSLKPDHINVLFYQGLLAAHMKKYGKAVTIFEQVVVRDPAYIEAHENLGRLYIRMGRIHDGIQEYQRVLELDPERAEAYLTLSALYIQVDMFQNALKLLQTFVQKFPEHPERSGAEELIRNIQQLLSQK